MKLDFRQCDSGVYQIVCLSTWQVYIGSTSSFVRRWMEHREALRTRMHHNYKLQRAWDTFGEYNFIFEIVERCAPEIRLQREQRYIDLLNPYFNIQRYVLPPVQTSRRAHLAKKKLAKQHMRTRYT